MQQGIFWYEERRDNAHLNFFFYITKILNILSKTCFHLKLVLNLSIKAFWNKKKLYIIYINNEI